MRWKQKDSFGVQEDIGINLINSPEIIAKVKPFRSSKRKHDIEANHTMLVMVNFGMA